MLIRPSREVSSYEDDAHGEVTGLSTALKRSQQVHSIIQRTARSNRSKLNVCSVLWLQFMLV